MVEYEHDQRPRRQGFRVSWTLLTIGLLVITAASLSTLVVVVSIKNVDVLSTVALALAVLAFAAQLIVSLAQAQGAAEQLTQAERINSQTQSALVEVRSSAQALLSNQSEQFNKVLSAALGSVTREAVREAALTADDSANADDGTREAIDVEQVASQIETRLLSAINAIKMRSGSPPPSRSPRRLEDAVGLEEGEAGLRLLGQLTPPEVTYIVNRLEYWLNVPVITLVAPIQQPWTSLTAKGVFASHEIGNRLLLGLTEDGRSMVKTLLGPTYKANWYRKMVREVS
jgi:hypothetical protein